ncbi:MAG TPA: hypothetical protein VKA68_18525 [bacterium]|nr:hypothetical protein [bacterium]
MQDRQIEILCKYSGKKRDEIPMGANIQAVDYITDPEKQQYFQEFEETIGKVCAERLVEVE